MESKSHAPVPPHNVPSHPTVPQQPGSGQPTSPQGFPVPTTRPQEPNIGLAVVGLVLGVMFFPPIGLILCIIAKRNSNKSGYDNSVAYAGVWINGALTALGVLAIVLLVLLAAHGVQDGHPVRW